MVSLLFIEKRGRGDPIKIKGRAIKLIAIPAIMDTAIRSR
jgi:hypothetical protein